MEPSELILVAFFLLLVGVIYTLFYGFYVIFSGMAKAPKRLEDEETVVVDGKPRRLGGRP